MWRPICLGLDLIWVYGMSVARIWGTSEASGVGKIIKWQAEADATMHRTNCTTATRSRPSRGRESNKQLEFGSTKFTTLAPHQPTETRTTLNSLCVPSIGYSGCCTWFRLQWRATNARDAEGEGEQESR